MLQTPLCLTSDTFDDIALRQDDRPVLIDFWAPWCGPCRVMDRRIAELAQEYHSSPAIIAKVNIDEEPHLASAMRIRSLPTLLWLRGGEVEEIMEGVQPKSQLRSRLQGMLDRAA